MEDDEVEDDEVEDDEVEDDEVEDDEVEDDEVKDDEVEDDEVEDDEVEDDEVEDDEAKDDEVEDDEVEDKQVEQEQDQSQPCHPLHSLAFILAGGNWSLRRVRWATKPLGQSHTPKDKRKANTKGNKATRRDKTHRTKVDWMELWWPRWCLGRWLFVVVCFVVCDFDCSRTIKKGINKMN